MIAKKHRKEALRAVKLRVVVHSLAQAQAALVAAAQCGAAVELISPPAASSTMGIGYFRTLVDLATHPLPEIYLDATMDCGDATGHALAALRVGFKRVVLAGHPDARRRVAAIARRCGARLVARPRGALDLLEVRDPAAACRALLAARIAKLPARD
jgi:hypothetical protein